MMGGASGGGGGGGGGGGFGKWLGGFSFLVELSEYSFGIEYLYFYKSTSEALVCSDSLMILVLFLIAY